jgi:uncharacterized protein (DUF1778 family)
MHCNPQYIDHTKMSGKTRIVRAKKTEPMTFRFPSEFNDLLVRTADVDERSQATFIKGAARAWAKAHGST